MSCTSESVVASLRKVVKLQQDAVIADPWKINDHKPSSAAADILRLHAASPVGLL